MVTTIITFIINGIIFLGLSLFIQEVWIYYVPVTLFLIICLLFVYNNRYKQMAKAIVKKHSKLFSSEEKKMLLGSPSLFLPNMELRTDFSRYEYVTAQSYMTLISLIYGVVSVFNSEWVALGLSLCIFLYECFFGIKFETDNSYLNAGVATRRYLKAKKMSIRNMTDDELMPFVHLHSDISTKLKNLAHKK